MRIVFIAFIIAILSCGQISADTVYLKNGRDIEGLVKSETDKTVVIDTAFGTVTLDKNQVRTISRSNEEGRRAILEKWDRDVALITKEKKALEKERQRRFEEYAKYQKEMAGQKKEKNPHEVNLGKLEGSKDILVEVLLNGAVKATLILDTGASQIILARRIGEKLGVDLSDTKNDISEIRLTGKKRLAKAIILKSIRAQGVEAKDIPACVLLEDVEVVGLKDGLLGMPFLNRFNCKIDLESMKMVLTDREQRKK